MKGDCDRGWYLVVELTAQELRGVLLPRCKVRAGVDGALGRFLRTQQSPVRWNSRRQGQTGETGMGDVPHYMHTRTDLAFNSCVRKAWMASYK